MPAISLRTIFPRPLLALLLAAVALIALRLDDVPVGAVTDDAYYVEMARSVAEGVGPVLVLGPERRCERPDIFPVGFPLLLAGPARMWPASLAALKIVPVLAALVLVVLAWWLPPPGSPAGLRLAIAAVTALNPWLVGWAGRILSDLPYAALALGALLVAARGCESGRDRRGEFLAAGLLAGAAIAVRTVGWSALLAIVAVLVAERRWRALPDLLVGVFAVLLPMWLLTRTGPLSAAYSAQMAADGGWAAWRFALDNFLGYVAQLPVLLVPIFGAPVQAVFARWHAGVLYPAAAFIAGTGLLLLAGSTCNRSWRSHPGRIRVRLAVFWILLTGAALVNFHGYPSSVQTRLLLPLLPVLAWLMLAAVWSRPQAARGLVAVMIAAALVHNGWRVARPMGEFLNPDGTGVVDPGRGTTHVRDVTEADEVVMTNDALQRHIHLRRPVLDLPEAPTALLADIAAHDVAYVLIAPAVHGTPQRLDPALQAARTALAARPDRFRPDLVDSNSAVFGYLVIR